jgi:hypothetical protein
MIDNAELAFLDDVRTGHFTLIESLSADLHRVAELVAKYDNLPLGTVRCFGDRLVVPRPGERIDVDDPPAVDGWWQALA